MFNWTSTGYVMVIASGMFRYKCLSLRRHSSLQKIAGHSPFVFISKYGSTLYLLRTTTGTLTTITSGAGTVNGDGKYTFKDFVSGTEKFQKGYTIVDIFITQTKATTDILFGATSTQSNVLASFSSALKSNVS